MTITAEGIALCIREQQALDEIEVDSPRVSIESLSPSELVCFSFIGRGVLVVVVVVVVVAGVGVVRE